MGRKSAEEVLQRQFQRTGNIGKSVESLEKKGYGKTEIEASLKNYVSSGKKEEAKSSNAEKRNARSFVLKFLIVSFSSALTVLVFFLVR